MSPAESEAAAAARAVGVALGRDLRMQLQAVPGFAELLARDDLSEEQRRVAEHLVDQSARLAHECDRLALLLRLTAQEPPPVPQSFRFDDLFALVNAVAAPVTPVAVRIHPQLTMPMEGDLEALHHLLAELVANAVLHGRRPIEVAVDLAGAPSGDRLPLRLTVSDAGPGLSEEFLSKINSGTPPAPSPDRIGIALATRLAGRLDGELRGIQRANGATEITLNVTLRDPAAKSDPLRSGASAAGVEGLRILLVDDNNVNRILTEQQVSRLGHQLESVATGADGVRRALAGGFDVILMDRHLPDLDGVEATRQIRTAESSRQLARTPIVAITADAQPGHREECLSAGMDGFITKPVQIERLRAAILAVAAGEVEPQPPGRLAPSAEVDFSALARLVDQFDGDSRPASELVRAYIDELPDRLTRLDRALDRMATQDAIAAAASLQSASNTVGAAAVARASADIRDRVRVGDFLAGREKFSDLAALGKRAIAVLDVSTNGQPIEAR